MNTLYEFLLDLLLSENKLVSESNQVVDKHNIEIDTINGDIFFYYYKADNSSGIEHNIRLRRLYIMKDFKMCENINVLLNKTNNIITCQLKDYIFDLPNSLQDIEVLFRLFVLSHNHSLKLRKPRTRDLCKENSLRYRGYDCKKVKPPTALNRLGRVNEYLNTTYSTNLDYIKINSHIQSFIFKYAIMYLTHTNTLNTLGWDNEKNLKQRYFKYKRDGLFLIINKGDDELHE